jgi:dienelactone hydrolase
MLARALLVYAAILGSLLFANAIAQPPLGARGQADVGDKSLGEEAPPKIKPAADRLKIGDLEQFFQPPPEYVNDFGSYRSPLRFYDGRSVTSAADWPARRREILDRWHKIMGPWPPLVEQPTIEYLETQRRDNFTQHRVRIQIAPDRFTDDAYLLKPDGSGPFPAVVVVYYDSQSGIGLGKSPLRDFAYQLARRGFVALSLGSAPETYYPSEENLQLQPLSFHAYVAANCWQVLANHPDVDGRRIGIIGHSYGGKWAMFASCLFDRFACAAWSDGGIVFDEGRANVNYWEPWYLGYERGGYDRGQPQRKAGIPTSDNPRTGAYKSLVEQQLDLHELHALMAPRPFLVSGGSEDTPHRWHALNHAIAVNKLLGHSNRVAMTNRHGHSPTPESNEQIYLFFERFLKNAPGRDE